MQVKSPSQPVRTPAAAWHSWRTWRGSSSVAWSYWRCGSGRRGRGGTLRTERRMAGGTARVENQTTETRGDSTGCPRVGTSDSARCPNLGPENRGRRRGCRHPETDCCRPERGSSCRPERGSCPQRGCCLVVSHPDSGSSLYCAPTAGRHPAGSHPAAACRRRRRSYRGSDCPSTTSTNEHVQSLRPFLDRFSSIVDENATMAPAQRTALLMSSAMTSREFGETLSPAPPGSSLARRRIVPAASR